MKPKAKKRKKALDDDDDDDEDDDENAEDADEQGNIEGFLYNHIIHRGRENCRSRQLRRCIT